MFTQAISRRTHAANPAGAAAGVEGVTTADGEAVVFVVDDDVSVRESLELLVQATGWRAETFASAAEFLSASHRAGPCCLVLDVTLPG